MASFPHLSLLDRQPEEMWWPSRTEQEAEIQKRFSRIVYRWRGRRPLGLFPPSSPCCLLGLS